MITLHTDVVGSLLRPPELLAARKQFARGEITATEFKRYEDRAVDEAVRLQEESGLQVVTDGEMRRESFQSQMPEAVEGFGEYTLDAFLWGDWHASPGSKPGEKVPEGWALARPANLGVVSKLKRRRSLSAEEFTYLRARTSQIAKVTLPSPSLWVNFWSWELSGHVYPTIEVFLADVTQILCEEVRELTRLGATYIQIDAPHYALVIDQQTRAFYEEQAGGRSLDEWLDHAIELDNAVMSAANSGVTFGFHLCRGNQASCWLAQGDYGPIATKLFKKIGAHRLLLEYDDARSGSFEALRSVPEDKMVVLGLVSTKTPQMETGQLLRARIQEASRMVGLDRLALSPQCGFASSILGNKLSMGDEKRKLRLVAETAREIWA